MVDSTTGNYLTCAGAEFSVVGQNRASAGVSSFTMVSDNTSVLGIRVATTGANSNPYGPFAKIAQPIGQNPYPNPFFHRFEMGMDGYSVPPGCDLSAYNAKEQPSLETNGNIVISCNVNLCPAEANMNNYWPR